MYFLLIFLLISCSNFNFEQKYKMEDVVKATSKEQAFEHIIKVDNISEYEYWLNLGIISPDYRDREGRTLLMFAKTREIAKMLVAKGADKDAITKKGFNALMFSSSSGNREVCKYFLDELQMDPNIPDNNGNVPLMLAGTKEILELLESRGADINAKDKNGSDALMIAACNGKKEACEYFIEKGISPKYKTVCGQTALMFAKTREIAKLLVDNGADKDAISISGDNVLILATLTGNKETCIYFLDELKIDPNYRGHCGFTALMRAQTEEMKKMLRQKGAFDTPPKDNIDKSIDSSNPAIRVNSMKFINKIERYLNFNLNKDDFMKKILILQQEAEDSICKYSLHNWLFFNCLQKKCDYRLEIVEFFMQNNKEYLPSLQKGYNFLHVAVYFKDSELFIKYFNEQYLYSTGDINKVPKVNPLQALFLLNLSDEAAILKFLKEIDSCLTKVNIEKSGALYMGCRLGMIEVVKYLIGKGADIRAKIKIEIPQIKTGVHTKEDLLKIKNYKLEFSALCLALNLSEYHMEEANDPLKILLTKVIISQKKGQFCVLYSYNGEKKYGLANILGDIVPCVYSKIGIDLENIIKEIFTDTKKLFPQKSDEEVAVIESNFLSKMEFRKDEAIKEQINIEKFISLIRLKTFDEINQKREYKEMKKLLIPILNDEDKNIPLSLMYDALLNHIKDCEYVKKISKEKNEKAAIKFLDMFCDCLDEVSGTDPSNVAFLKSNFKTESILELIRDGHFGVARVLIRFPEKFDIKKNKVFINKGKKKGDKRVNSKKTWLDKINALIEESEIDGKELDETISLARDKGWMIAEEVEEIQMYESEKRKKEKDRKKGQAFKELQEYNEDQQKQKLEGDEKRNSKAEKRREQKETKSEEDRDALEYSEEKVNYFELDEEKVNKTFEELVMSSNKEELVVLINKVGKKIDKSFKVVKAIDEKVRQLLIIRGFIVNRELILSILEKNQKKVMTTLLREIVKEEREKIFSFSEEDMKIEITEEMQEIMGKYGKGFKVIKEEKVEIKKEGKKKIEYEIYNMEEIDEGSKLYLFDKECNARTLLALQNMKEGRGDVKKINSKEELFEYRMLGHGEEGNLRIYYKQEENRKIILEVSYKGTDELSVRKIEALERKSKDIDLNKIELINF